MSTKDSPSKGSKPTSKGLEGAERLSKRIGGEVTLGDTILEVRDLGVRFWVNDEWFTAAEGLTYDLAAGEVLAIVGESGSGNCPRTDGPPARRCSRAPS